MKKLVVLNPGPRLGKGLQRFFKALRDAGELKRVGSRMTGRRQVIGFSQH